MTTGDADGAGASISLQNTLRGGQGVKYICCTLGIWMTVHVRARRGRDKTGQSLAGTLLLACPDLFVFAPRRILDPCVLPRISCLFCCFVVWSLLPTCFIVLFGVLLFMVAVLLPCPSYRLKNGACLVQVSFNRKL